MYVSRKIYVAIDEPHWLRPMRAKNDVVDLNLLLSLLVLLLLLHIFFSLYLVVRLEMLTWLNLWCVRLYGQLSGDRVAIFRFMFAHFHTFDCAVAIEIFQISSELLVDWHKNGRAVWFFPPLSLMTMLTMFNVHSLRQLFNILGMAL